MLNHFPRNSIPSPVPRGPTAFPGSGAGLEKRFLSERQVGPSLADSFPRTQSIFQQLNIQRATQSIWMLVGISTFFIFPLYSLLLLFKRKLMRLTGFWRNLTQFLYFILCSLLILNNIEIIYQPGQKKLRNEAWFTEEYAKSMGDFVVFCFTQFCLFFYQLHVITVQKTYSYNKLK